MKKAFPVLLVVLMSTVTFASAYPQSLGAVEAEPKATTSNPVEQLIKEHEGRMEQIRQNGADTASGTDDASSTEGGNQADDDKPMTPDEEAITKMLGFRANLQPTPTSPAPPPATAGGPANRILLERISNGVPIGCVARRNGDVYSIEPLSGPDAGNLIVGSTYAFTTDIPGVGQLSTTCAVSDAGLSVKHQAAGFADTNDQAAWTDPSYASAEQ